MQASEEINPELGEQPSRLRRSEVIIGCRSLRASEADLAQQGALGPPEAKIGAVMAQDAVDQRPAPLDTGARRRADVSTAICVANANDTPWLQHATDFPQRPLWIAQVIQHGMYEHRIESAVLELQSRDVPSLE